MNKKKIHLRFEPQNSSLLSHISTTTLAEQPCQKGKMYNTCPYFTKTQKKMDGYQLESKQIFTNKNSAGANSNKQHWLLLQITVDTTSNRK